MDSSLSATLEELQEGKGVKHPIVWGGVIESDESSCLVRKGSRTRKVTGKGRGKGGGRRGRGVGRIGEREGKERGEGKGKRGEERGKRRG